MKSHDKKSRSFLFCRKNVTKVIGKRDERYMAYCLDRR